MTPFERRWISPKQAGQYLELSTAAIYRLAAQKKLPAARIGHSLRIDLRSLEMQLQRQLEKRAKTEN
jgi:excisionase family DNA binding protein